jgi:molybdopterin synthase catalytic subunit
MIVRPVQLPADRAEWLRMRLSLWPSYPAGEVEAEVDSYAAVGRINHQATQVFVIDRGYTAPGKLGGFVEVSLRPLARGCTTSPVGYVEGWFVDADLRRYGFGANMITAAEEWAKSKGCSEMASDCNAHNRVSHSAHLALGFAHTDSHLHFRKPLVLDLPPAPDDWIAIVAEPLSVDVAVKLVSDARAGGIDLFLGVTREDVNPSGQHLVALDYEAFEEMALAQLRTLANKARERWPIARLAILHRIGRVPVGDASVLIAVACPHRGEAFDACRFLIDGLKAEAAIWKKDVWDDGGESWVKANKEWKPTNAD